MNTGAFPTRFEWKRRAELAEFAEAIELPSDHVIAVHREGDGEVVTVLYTETVTGDFSTIPVWARTFVRDRNGVLRAYAPATKVLDSLDRLLP